MAAPTIVQQTEKAGDTWRATVQIFEDDGVTPSDLTGYSARMQLRRNPYDVAALATATVIPDLPGSSFAFVLSGAQTALCVGLCYADIEITDALAQIDTPITIRFNFIADNTQ